MGCELCDRVVCVYCHWRTLYHRDTWTIVCATCGAENGWAMPSGIHQLLREPVPQAAEMDLGDYLPISMGPIDAIHWHDELDAGTP